MKRIIFALFFLFFFLDFSFLPLVNKLYLGNACLMSSFLILLLIENNFWENIFWIIIASLLINIVAPLYFEIYLLIWLILLGFTYFIKATFVADHFNLFKRNIIFVLTLFLYRMLLNLSLVFLNKNIHFKDIIMLHSPSLQTVILKIVISIIAYNFIYKVFFSLVKLRSEKKFSF